MFKIWVSASEIAAALSIIKRAVNKRATQGNWMKRVFDANGGKQYRYRLADLLEDVQIAYAASLQTSLEALRAEFTPVEKAEKEADVPHCSNRAKKEDTYHSPVIIMSLRQTLEMASYEVLTASDGTEAQASIKGGNTARS
jgi:hypothetical protein